MERRLHINQDVMAGLMFIIFGGFFIYFGRDLQVGTALRMGPGYLPNLLGWLLIAVGAGIAAKGAWTAGERIESFAFRPLIFVCGAFFVFSQTIERFGLPAAAIVTMFCAAIAGADFRAREMVYVSIFAAIGASLLFVLGLGLPMRLWPDWLNSVIYG